MTDAMRSAIAKAIFENLVASTDVDGMPIISGINSATSAVLALVAAPVPPPDGTAEPDYEAAARALGYQQVPSGTWFHPNQHPNFTEWFKSAQDIFDRYFGQHWLAPLPSDDVRSALADIKALCQHHDQYTLDHFAKKIAAKVDAALHSAPVSAPAHPVIEVPLTFLYKNHRGEIALRNVFPVSVRFGTTEWHPEAQWLLKAFDREKQAEREFAMRDISAPAVGVTREAIAIEVMNVRRRIHGLDDLDLATLRRIKRDAGINEAFAIADAIRSLTGAKP